jgi:hypothetical protein
MRASSPIGPTRGCGASSSGTSTTATRSPAVGASTSDANVAAVAAAVATAAAANSCCGPVATTMPRGRSPVAAALPAALGALDKRRLIGTDVSDLRALAGAKVGTIGVTLRTRKHKNERQPLKLRTHGGSAAHLKLEKPHFLFLEGSGVAAVTPADAAVVLAGAPAVLVGSSNDGPVAGASAPAMGTCSTYGQWRRRRGIPPLRGARPPSLSSSSSSSSFDDDDNEFAGIPGKESPCCSRSRYSSLCCSWHSRRLILLSFSRATHSCSRRCAVRAATRARCVGGSDHAASTVTIC